MSYPKFKVQTLQNFLGTFCPKIFNFARLSQNVLANLKCTAEKVLSLFYSSSIMFDFGGTFYYFKKELTAALSTALADIDTKCTFTIDDGQCNLLDGEKPGLRDEIQAALQTMEWGDVQVCDNFDLELDWSIFDCMEQVCIWIEPGDKYEPMTPHLVCKDKKRFEEAMFEAGYTLPPTQRKRARDTQDEETTVASPTKRAVPDIIDLTSDE